MSASDGGCIFLMVKVSWPLRANICEDMMEFFRLLVLKVKDRGEEAVEIHKELDKLFNCTT